MELQQSIRTIVDADQETVSALESELVQNHVEELQELYKRNEESFNE